MWWKNEYNKFESGWKSFSSLLSHFLSWSSLCRLNKIGTLFHAKPHLHAFKICKCTERAKWLISIRRSQVCLMMASGAIFALMPHHSIKSRHGRRHIKCSSPRLLLSNKSGETTTGTRSSDRAVFLCAQGVTESKNMQVHARERRLLTLKYAHIEFADLVSMRRGHVPSHWAPSSLIRHPNAFSHGSATSAMRAEQVKISVLIYSGLSSKYQTIPRYQFIQ